MPAKQKTPDQFLGQEDPLEKGKSTHSSILAWVTKSWTQLSTFHFTYSSVGKESACNEGDHSSIPGSGRSPGEGIGYPLQYSWASLAAQTVKSPPAMQEIPVQFLGQEDPLEKGSAQFSRSVVSDSLQSHEPPHARPPCPSPTPRVYANSCPLSQ